MTKPKVEVTEFDLREEWRTSSSPMMLARCTEGVRSEADPDGVRGAAVSAGGAQAAYAALTSLDPLAEPLASSRARKWAHDAKALERGAIAAGLDVGGLVFDTLLAGYLLDAAAADYPLRALCEKYLGADVLGEIEDEAEGQLFGEAGWRRWRRRPPPWLFSRR